MCNVARFTYSHIRTSEALRHCTMIANTYRVPPSVLLINEDSRVL